MNTEDDWKTLNQLRQERDKNRYFEMARGAVDEGIMNGGGDTSTEPTTQESHYEETVPKQVAYIYTKDVQLQFWYRISGVSGSVEFESELN